MSSEKEPTSFTCLSRRAREFAEKAHGNQKYGPHPYMYHLDGVATEVAYMYDTDRLNRSMYQHCTIVAYLHDVLEDTNVGPEEIRKAFGEEVLRDVRLLTRPKQMMYHQYIQRLISEDGTLQALIVKSADLRFNIAESAKNKDSCRIAKHRWDKYQLALSWVNQALSSGRPIAWKNKATGEWSPIHLGETGINEDRKLGGPR